MARTHLITATESKFFFGTLNGDKANYGSYSDGTHHNNIGPCIVEIRIVHYAEFAPSWYAYIDGLHQCGGRIWEGDTLDSIAAKLHVAGTLVPVEDAVAQSKAEAEVPATNVDAKGRLVTCPECGGPVVWDSGLWHCDEGPNNDGCGAWESKYVVRTVPQDA